jgi:hypothetical protein
MARALLSLVGQVNQTGLAKRNKHMRVSGSCLCGAVAYEVEEPFDHFLYCHCARCRKATGTAHAANAVVDPSAFRWTKGDTDIVRYDLPSARSFATAFCRHCGSPMPHLTRSGKRMIVPAGTFDGEPCAKPSVHAYWKSRADWFTDDPNLRKADEAEF